VVVGLQIVKRPSSKEKNDDLEERFGVKLHQGLQEISRCDEVRNVIDMRSVVVIGKLSVRES